MATTRGVLGDVDAISVAAQQHSTIMLNDYREPIMDAILWNDQRASGDALDLRCEFGAQRWATEIGTIPTAAHPVSKLRWLRRTHPHLADQVRTVAMPHDWLTWHLLGKPAEITTDRSDASGTGYWAPRTGRYRQDIAELALGRTFDSPRVMAPFARVGTTANGTIVAAGSGDNAAAVFGLDTDAGELVVSIGTSLTASMISAHPVGDSTGHVSNMADIAGAQLPMVATLNGSRTLVATARMLAIGLEELDQLAATAALDADGLSFLPYLEGERTPVLPFSTGALTGMTRTSMTPENIARAAILGLACAVTDAIDDFARTGLTVKNIVLIGGGARSASLRQAIADLTRREVTWPEPREYAALGAARQAAWALTGDQPDWPPSHGQTISPRDQADWAEQVLARYRDSRRVLFGF